MPGQFEPTFDNRIDPYDRGDLAEYEHSRFGEGTPISFTFSPFRIIRAIFKVISGFFDQCI